MHTFAAAVRSRLGLFVLLGLWLNPVGLCRLAADERVSRWEGEIRKFEEQDRQSPPEKNGVLFLGSSSIRLWKLTTSFPSEAEKGYLNRGFGGSQLADVIPFVDRIVTPYSPRVIVLYCGDNDLAAGKSPKQIADDFQTLVRRIHDKTPTAKILYVSIKASLARWKLAEPIREANRLIAESCRGDERLTYIDVFQPMLGDDGLPRAELLAADKLHLSSAGYELWTSLVKPKIEAAKR